MQERKTLESWTSELRTLIKRTLQLRALEYRTLLQNNRTLEQQITRKWNIRTENIKH